MSHFYIIPGQKKLYFEKINNFNNLDIYAVVMYFIAHFNAKIWVYIVLMYMYLFLWGFLYGVNVYVFIPMVFFITKNYHKWVHMKMDF